LQALRFEHLKEPSFRLLVVFVDEGEALGATVGVDAFAGNHLEPALGARLLIFGVDETAIQTHG